MEMAYADLSETTNFLLLPAAMDWHCISDALTTSRYFLPFLLWLVLAAFFQKAQAAVAANVQFRNLKNRGSWFTDIKISFSRITKIKM